MKCEFFEKKSSAVSWILARTGPAVLAPVFGGVLFQLFKCVFRFLPGKLGDRPGKAPFCLKFGHRNFIEFAHSLQIPLVRFLITLKQSYSLRTVHFGTYSLHC